MKRRTLKIEVFLCSVNGFQIRSTKKSNRRFLVASLLLLFGATLTTINGQTVNYEFDANGNVVSKKVVQPLDVTNFKARQDSIPTFANFLAYYSPFKEVSYPIFTLTTAEKETIKIPYKVNDNSFTEKPYVATLLPDNIERYLVVNDKKKDYNSN